MNVCFDCNPAIRFCTRYFGCFAYWRSLWRCIAFRITSYWHRYTIDIVHAVRRATGRYLLHVVTQLAVGFNANESVTDTMRTMHGWHLWIFRISVQRCSNNNKFGLRCQLRTATAQTQYFYLCHSVANGNGERGRIYFRSCRMHMYRISFDLDAHRTADVTVWHCQSLRYLHWRSETHKSNRKMLKLVAELPRPANAIPNASAVMVQV